MGRADSDFLIIPAASVRRTSVFLYPGVRLSLAGKRRGEVQYVQNLGRG